MYFIRQFTHQSCLNSRLRVTASVWPPTTAWRAVQGVTQAALLECSQDIRQRAPSVGHPCRPSQESVCAGGQLASCGCRRPSIRYTVPVHDLQRAYSAPRPEVDPRNDREVRPSITKCLRRAAVRCPQNASSMLECLESAPGCWLYTIRIQSSIRAASM